MRCVRARRCCSHFGPKESKIQTGNNNTTQYSTAQHPIQSQEQEQDQDTACVQDEIIKGNEFFSPSGYDKKMR